MKNRLIIFLLALLPRVGMCQQYTVYSVVGGARIVNGKKLTPIAQRTMLSNEMSVQIDAESAVTVLDEKNYKMYSFTSKGIHTVGQLIDMVKKSGKNLTKQYMSYLVKQMFSDDSRKMSHPDTYMQVVAAAYRSTSNDSLLIDKIADALDGKRGKMLELALVSRQGGVTTDYDISFDLISCETGVNVGEQVAPGTSCYVRVTNSSNEVLYVNLLDIDSEGNKYLVLPVDAASSCSHLLVPPMSIVSFKESPFIFSDCPSEEAFLLMATEEPVDFSIVMSPMQTKGGRNGKAGFYRKFYQVK